MGKEAEVAAITREGIDGRIDWEQGFRLRAAHLRGLTRAQILRAAQELRPMPGAKDFVAWLQARSTKVVLVTGGPREVAESALALFNADTVFSNEFHYEDGVFTGDVTIYVSRAARARSCVNSRPSGAFGRTRSSRWATA